MKNKKAQDFEPAQIIMTVMLIVAAAGVVFGWNIMFKGQRLAENVVELEERKVAMENNFAHAILVEMLRTKDSKGITIAQLIIMTEYEDDYYGPYDNLDTTNEYDSDSDGQNDRDLSEYTKGKIEAFLNGMGMDYVYYVEVKYSEQAAETIVNGNKYLSRRNHYEEAETWLPAICQHGDCYKIKVWLELGY